MSREHPWKCPHGNMLGGHESFGYEDSTCRKCEIRQNLLKWIRWGFAALGVVAIFDWLIIPLILGLPPMTRWR